MILNIILIVMTLILLSILILGIIVFKKLSKKINELKKITDIPNLKGENQIFQEFDNVLNMFNNLQNKNGKRF